MIIQAHGDQQRARLRLRAPTQHKTHHWATFRTGTFIGLSVPAIVHGVYFCKMHPLPGSLDGLQKLICFSLPGRHETRNTSVGSPSPGLWGFVCSCAVPVVDQFQHSHLDSFSDKLCVYFRWELSSSLNNVTLI